MLETAPRHDMYEMYSSGDRLDDFQVFRNKTPYTYSNYYTDYYEPEILPTAEYHNLLNMRDYRDDSRYKPVGEWTEDETLAWIIETVKSFGYSEYEFSYFSFRVTGSYLVGISREEMLDKMQHPNVELTVTRRIADYVYDKLQQRLNEERHSILRHTGSVIDQYAQPSNLMDLDTCKSKYYASDYKPNDLSLLAGVSDTAIDVGDRYHVTDSPDYSLGSDGSKSGDEDDKTKMGKRPPGRPRGSGRKLTTTKRPRNVSVPQFLLNLLMDSKYNPSIIKWEDRSTGKFRFTKPDAVASMWGEMKQNTNMNFEKFSRAMRYHYKQGVLVSVPTARLVYQFGSKGPDFRIDDPDLEVKAEIDSHDMLYS